MNKKVRKGLRPYLFIILIMAAILYFINANNRKTNYITYDKFISSMNNGEIENIKITPKTNARVYEISGKLKTYEEDESFFLRVPLAEEVMSQILEGVEVNNFEIKTNADPSSSTILAIIVNVLPIVLLVGIGFFFISRQMSSANKSMDLYFIIYTLLFFNLRC